MAIMEATDKNRQGYVGVLCLISCFSPSVKLFFILPGEELTDSLKFIIKFLH